MRKRHEIENGIICERCLCIAKKGNYTTVKFFKPIIEDTTGRTEIISRMNLCNDCYNEYKKMTEFFTGRNFIEKQSNRKKIESLSMLREQLINLKKENIDDPKIIR